MKSSVEGLKAILPLVLLAIVAGPAVAQYAAPQNYSAYGVPYMAQGQAPAQGSTSRLAPGPAPVAPYGGPAYQGQPFLGQPYQGQPYQGQQYQTYIASDGLATEQAPAQESACAECNGEGCERCGLGGGWFGGWGDRIFNNQRDYLGDTIADPRWFNFNIEGIFLTRDRVSRTVNFTRQNGDVVLSNNSLDFDAEPGIRFTAQLPIGQWSSVEGIYFGTNYWDSTAQVNGAGNLFSAFSTFGAAPAGGYAETDAASFHSISYSSRLHNIELNWRQRFMSPNGRIHSSVMTGIRYVNLNETFIHTTIAGPNSLFYQIQTTNDLLGWQGGFDLSMALTPRLTISGLCKLGIYGNTATQTTQINTNAAGGVELPNAANENANATNGAFVGDAGVLLVYRISPCVSLTGGYQYVFIDGVALAIENFNVNPAFGTRAVNVNDNGNVQLHGGSFGIEYRW